jgi:hypothetical protein
MCLESMVVYVTDNASSAVKSARDVCDRHEGCAFNMVAQKCMQLGTNKHRCQA